MSEMDADVIVVGAGPSGLTTAAELALQGARVLVFERRTTPVQSRAGTVLPRVLELLDYRGHADRFIARAAAIRKNPFLLFHIWAGMQPVHWRLLRTEFPYRLILPQSVTEEVLDEIVAEAAVPVHRGHTVVGLSQDSDRASAVTEDENGTRRTWTAGYIVGADGGRSAVRTLAGIPFEGHDGTFTGIIVDLPLDMKWPAGRGMADNEHGWGASFPFGADGATTRFNLVHAERRHADKSEPVTVEEVRSCIRDIFGLELEFDHLLWASRFTDAMRVAGSLRSGRVFLVGESARIHYPASGVGMNFCIQDAFDLGWKLGRVATGASPASILDTYEADRRPVIDGLLESVQAQCSIQFDFTPEGIAFRRMFARDILPQESANREIGLQLNGLSAAYPTARSGADVAGRPIPPLTIRTAEGQHTSAELLREGRLLTLDLVGDGAFADLEAPGVTVISGVIPNPPEHWGTITAAIVRPDGFVHWATSERPADLTTVRDALADWVTIP
ncbi:FAD-dependent oxidoreductase [Microbacterium sp. 22303]|uniref:FAD-dependent oxidoreductase n=1 Tax=Microbacterium sp. 22303 TaxID=3453905 RepID=UPI003F877B17